VTDSWTDPASLQGDALTQWYLRSPADVERERQAAAAQRYQDFFHGGSGNDPDPGFGREVPASSRGIDPGFAITAPASSQDIDPGFTWIPAGPNRWRSVKTEDLQPPSPTTLTPYDLTAPSGDGMGGFADDEDGAAPTMSSYGLDLTPQPLAQPTDELRMPPALTYGATTRPSPAAAGMRGPGLSRPSSLRPMPPPALARGPTAPPSKAGGPIAYGALRAPAPSDQELAELRRQQAAFANTTRQIDIHNSWFAVPALAPAVVALGLGAAGEWATGEVAPAAGRAVANFVDREAWQRGAQKAAQALSDAEKNALRAAARAKFARANGISARGMQAEVHHSDPLEWAHLKPNADPNRLANLWGLRGEAHDIATRAWADFTRGLKGRIPTQAELMEAKLRIDRMVEPYLRRAGVPRSNTPPREGGPI
jgi:hypothetical protein